MTYRALGSRQSQKTEEVPKFELKFSFYLLQERQGAHIQLPTRQGYGPPRGRDDHRGGSGDEWPGIGPAHGSSYEAGSGM